MPYAGAPAPAPALDPRARTAGILMLVCALALLIGIGSKSWFTDRGGSSLGVLGIEECRGMVCHSITWLDAKRAPGEIQAFSVLALLGGLAGIGFLIHAGVVLLMGKANKILYRGLNISLGIAAFGIVSFFFRFSVGDYSRGVSTSWAGILAVATVIAAAILLPVMVRPLQRAAAAQLPPPPMPVPGGYPPPGNYPPPA
jgi:hypothetical protein